MNELLTYARYYSEEDAEDVVKILKENKISYHLKHEKGLLDKIYIGDTVDPMYELKIDPDDFNTLNQLLQADAATHIESLPDNYYLLQFSDSELLQVVQHPNEWNAFDIGIATTLLSKKGVPIPTTSVLQPEQPFFTPIAISPVILILEYAMSAVILFAGFIIGLSTLLAYKTLFNGKRVAMFNETAIKHAKIFIVLGIIRLLVFCYWIMN